MKDILVFLHSGLHHRGAVVGRTNQNVLMGLIGRSQENTSYDLPMLKD